MGKPVTIRIAGDTKLLSGSLKKANKGLKGLGKAGKAAGLAMAAGLAVGVAGIVKLGSTFEQVERTLRVGTGATGDALEALTDITKSIAANVPADFESVATAVADINTRLGMTGPELEAFATQMLNLSRITGTDLEGNISSVSRAMGDWGDQAGTAAGAADFLFSVAQSTGIEVGRLSDQLVAYGAPLRQVGFTFEESALLIGKFEKEGVNAELVLGSLRQALGKMAREGEPAIDTFRRTVDAIENAGDASEANRLALELFGARAGPDMAAAIREGRFELDDYFELMDGGGDRINAAAAETQTLGEKLTILKNRVIIALAPAVETAFAAITSAFEALAPKVEELVAKFREFTQTEGFQNFLEIIATGLERLREIFEIVRAKVAEFIDENPEAFFAALAVVIGTVLVGAVVALISALATLLSPVLLIVAAVALLAAGVVYAYNEFELFRTIVDAVWDGLKAWVGFLLDVMVPAWSTAIDLVVGYVTFLWEQIRRVVDLVVAVFSGDMGDAWDSLKNMASTAVDAVLEVFGDLPQTIYDSITAGAAWLYYAGSSIGRSLLDGIGDALGGAVDWVSGLGKDIANALIGFVNSLIDDLNRRLEIRIDGPGFLPDINLNPPDIPRIPRLAGGGIVSGGPRLAVVGERGPEAVIPLNQAGRMGSSITINLPAGADGDDVVAALRKWEAQNGPIPIATR